MTVPGWLRERKVWLSVGGVAALAAAYGFGRFAAPTKIETREVTREVSVVDEKEVARRLAQAKTEWEKNVQDHTRVETRYVEGKPVIKIEYRDRETQSSGTTEKVKIEYVDREVVKYIEKVVTVEKIVERDCPRVTLLGSVGAGFKSGEISPPAYGAEVNARVWGPLTLGVGGEGNMQGGSARVLFGAQF